MNSISNVEKLQTFHQNINNNKNEKRKTKKQNKIKIYLKSRDDKNKHVIDDLLWIIISKTFHIECECKH